MSVYWGLQQVGSTTVYRMSLRSLAMQKFPLALCCVCTDGFNLKMSDFFCFGGYFIDKIINGKHVVFGSVEILDDVMFLVSAVALKVKYKTSD